MDTATATAIGTIVISVVSLGVSASLALRQVRTASDGYALPVVLNVFSQFRTQEFFDAQQYVFYQLHQDFAQPIPFNDLPVEPRSHLRMVAGLYDDLGKLVAHGIIKEELVIGSNGVQARRIWEAVEPYVLAERHKNRSGLWIYLEDLAYRTTRNPPSAVHAKLKLHRYPSRRPPAVPPARSPQTPDAPAGA
ncbi:DUF4760 domain-containing protein [Catenuloplanes atrovinosus]|uniref:Uncharacterized protein n=1 Tax=Catenuloplanes atrovinosus TaxID=137266 RepID=A0AAE3YQL8_9ACTN|nr:hypothetical protein [Catenuloplanes atrovinosus]MDR7275991.1 hypothetical protein [Catenuloplanes atrovinosus]